MSHELQGVKVAILVEKLYEDRELWYPADRLKEAGAQVVLVGPKAGEEYPSKYGYPAKAEKAASSVSADDFDGVVIPGGYSPDHMRRHEAMVKFVRDMAEKGKVVAAICHAGWMLCSAKVLKGRRVTSFASIRDDMEHAGGNWVDEEVVRDGNLVTSRHPGDLPAFMSAILAALAESRAGR
ncbi:MAG: type 1 glutamine amidotransferase domain-containing protein [Planctomycetaceae bacterium]